MNCIRASGSLLASFRRPPVMRLQAHVSSLEICFGVTNSRETRMIFFCKDLGSDQTYHLHRGKGSNVEKRHI